MNHIINSILTDKWHFTEAVRSKVCPQAFAEFSAYINEKKPHGWTDMMEYAEKMDNWMKANKPELFGDGDAYQYTFEKECGSNWYVVTFRAAIVAIRGKEFWEKWKKENKEYAWSDV